MVPVHGHSLIVCYLYVALALVFTAVSTSRKSAKVFCAYLIFLRSTTLIKHRRITRAYRSDRLGLAVPLPRLTCESGSGTCCLRGAQQPACCLQCLPLYLASICNCWIKDVRSYVPAYPLQYLSIEVFPMNLSNPFLNLLLLSASTASMKTNFRSPFAL